MEALREKLSRLRVDSRGAKERKCFYPFSEVEKLLTLQATRELISSIPSLNGQDRDLFRFASLIKQSHLRIFAILLRDGNHTSIPEFLARRETDSRIPYTEDALYFLPHLVARSFFERQWEFHPVVLRRDDIPQKLHEKAILPFLGEWNVGKGGYSTVWKVEIHHSCQDLVSERPKGFPEWTTAVSYTSDIAEKGILIARKELNDANVGESERGILDLLQTLRHPNIVEFLGSYTQHGVQNLLFPYISRNLGQWFSEMPVIDPHVIYTGIYGLADALSRIHDFTFKNGSIEISKIGFHHDLRPANSLVQNDTFIIADFGLSKLKSDDQDSKSRLRGGHDDYLGPESFNEVDWTNGMVGRALDIWAFGCILTEFASFIERLSLTEFRTKREETHGRDISVTDYAFHLDGKVKPAVLQWLTRIASSPSDPHVSRLVDIARDLLNPNPYKRTKILKTRDNLALLARDSKVHAIDQIFEKLSYNTEDRTSDFNILVLLEQKRFKAWDSAFGRLNREQMLQDIDAVLKDLKNLHHVLTSDEMPAYATEDSSSAREDPLKQISASVDLICMNFPTEAKEKIQELWSRAVCEIESIEVLAAIRTTTKPERYRSVGISAAMKYMSCVISRSIKIGGSSRYIDSGCVDVDKLSPIASLGQLSTPLIDNKSMTMGYYSGEHDKARVLIEWKEYDARWQGDEGRELYAIMDSLVRLLDPNETPREGVAKHRVLDCVGYVHESWNHRFGFLYTLKPHADQHAAHELQLYSLNNIIRMTARDLDSTIRPHLGDLFLLAKELAACLLALHNAGWLHKNISSHHILVLSDSAQEVYQHVSSAVLVGFNDSRPEASSITLGPKQEFQHYQSPLYRRGVTFRKSFDYFSLGIVLLELGTWLPISVLYKEHLVEFASPEEFRKKLLKSYVPLLGEVMGTLYRDAVDFCLDAEERIGSFQEDPEDHCQAQDMFRQEVVERLSRCFA